MFNVLDENSVKLLLIFLHRLHSTTKDKDNGLNEVVNSIIYEFTNIFSLQYQNMEKLTNGLIGSNSSYSGKIVLYILILSEKVPFDYTSFRL